MLEIEIVEGVKLFVMTNLEYITLGMSVIFK